MSSSGNSGVSWCKTGMYGLGQGRWRGEARGDEKGGSFVAQESEDRPGLKALSLIVHMSAAVNEPLPCPIGALESMSWRIRGRARNQGSEVQYIDPPKDTSAKP